MEAAVSFSASLMTYSLNTLNASSAGKSGPRSPGARFGHEITLMAGFVVLVVWMLALWSYAPQDPAWSTSGAAAEGGAQPHWACGRLVGRCELFRLWFFRLVVPGGWCARLAFRRSLACCVAALLPKARLRGVRPLGALFFGVAWPC
jgi:hypothetical protein